jgi:hypothetical protein
MRLACFDRNSSSYVCGQDCITRLFGRSWDPACAQLCLLRMAIESAQNDDLVGFLKPCPQLDMCAEIIAQHSGFTISEAPRARPALLAESLDPRLCRAHRSADSG